MSQSRHFLLLSASLLETLQINAVNLEILNAVNFRDPNRDLHRMTGGGAVSNLVIFTFDFVKVKISLCVADGKRIYIDISFQILI